MNLMQFNKSNYIGNAIAKQLFCFTFNKEKAKFN